MNIAFLEKVLVGAGFIIAVVMFVAHLVGHPEPPPAPPVMTTQQAYDQICGHPDVCASMHNFVQQVQAEKQYLEISPPPGSPDPDKADQASDASGSPAPPASR